MATGLSLSVHSWPARIATDVTAVIYCRGSSGDDTAPDCAHALAAARMSHLLSSNCHLCAPPPYSKSSLHCRQRRPTTQNSVLMPQT